MKRTGFKKMKNKKLSLILLIIWMIFIFIISSFNAIDSSNQSGYIVSTISNIFNIKNVELLTFIIRKLAHFTEYLILGIFTVNTIINYRKNISLSYIICILYAISDEIHQLFIIGRSCEIRDIIIDTIGAVIGIIIFKKLLKKN